jgi:hypothetical protein
MMRAAPPLVFPSSRVLAGWWRQLAPLAPRALAVGHLLLHHVEALVQSERPADLDPFAALVLRALTLPPPPTLADLDGRLHLGRQVLARVLGDLAAGGLAEVDAAGRWGAAPRRAGYERRAFHFRDARPEAQFVPLESASCHPVAAPDGWSFDPALLRACAGRPEEWKRRHGFPTDVRAVLAPDAPEAAGEPPAWRRVVVDRPEHLVAALAVVSGEGGEGQLRGFVVESRGWLLSGTRPALTMGPGWAEAFPEMATGPSSEAWHGAWRAWCQVRGLPPGEADSCTLSREGVLLRVGAPRELIGRLHSANGEAARDEVWLLAGEGAMRTAARVELV